MTILNKGVIITLFVLFLQAATALSYNSAEKNVKNLNSRPVIGIVTQPTYGDFKKWAPHKDQYINSGYVKWIQAAGGLAIAIPHTATKAELQKLYSMINGVIFPGGATDLFDSKYREALDVLYDEAVQENNLERIVATLESPTSTTCTHYDDIIASNDTCLVHKTTPTFPLWGTCLGFQYMAIRGNNGARDTLGDYFANNISLPVEPTQKMFSSKLFSTAHPIERKLMIQHMQQNPSTANVHYHGIPPSLFQTSTSLNNSYDLLGTSIGQDGKEFVAMMENKNHPFFAVQYHPERSLFEWADRENIVKDFSTIRLQSYFAAMFVNEARNNKHRFPTRAIENRWNLNGQYSKLFFGPLEHEDEDQGYYMFKHSDFPLDTLY